MKYRLTVSLLFFFCLVAQDSAFSSDYTFLQQWGDQRLGMDGQPTQLTRPRGVAIDSDGSIYVSAAYKNGIYKYQYDHLNQLTAVDTIGYCNAANSSPLYFPMQLAVANNHDLYVADMYNNRICVYDSEGNWKKTITSGFNQPIGVAVDNNLNVYVVDGGNNAVKKFNSSGTLIATWSGFNNPWGITLYGGYVFVTDSSPDGMVWKYTPEGLLLKRWGAHGVGDGQLLMAEGIAAYSNLLYVADGEYGRIHVFDLEGTWLRTIGERGTGNGQLQFSSALAVAADDANAADATYAYLYVSDDDNDRVMRFNLKVNPPAYSTKWGCDVDTSSASATGLRYPTKIAVDKAHGVMYVVDSGNYKIRKMTLYPNMGEILPSFGGYGNGDGKFRFPIDAAVDSAGNVYVVDNLNRNIQKFSSGGSFIAKWPVNFDPLVTLYGLHAIAIDSAGNIYVIDAGTNKAYKLDTLGNKTGEWSVDSYPTGIALDEDQGYIYVSSFSDRIKQYDMDGAPTGKVIGQGGANPQNNLVHPYSMAVNSGGNLIVADTFSNRLAKFGTVGANGNFITSIGTSTWAGSTSPGEFAFPYGVAVDGAGYVYAADTNNHRIQVFRQDVYTLSTESQANGTLSCPATSGRGASQVCTITPNSGYYLSGLMDNGNPVIIPLTGNTYTIANIASDHTIRATFQSIETPPVRVVSGTSETPYDTVRLAYTSPVTNDDVIELQPITYTGESPDFDLELNFTLRGGVNFSSSAQSGYSIITQKLTISHGTVTLDHIIVR